MGHENKKEALNEFADFSDWLDCFRYCLWLDIGVRYWSCYKIDNLDQY